MTMTRTRLTSLILATALGMPLSVDRASAQNPFQRQAMPSIGNLDPSGTPRPPAADRLLNQRVLPDELRPVPRPPVSNPTAHNCVRLFGKRWSCATSPNRITTIDGDDPAPEPPAQ
ncbi:hypothetical protein [Amaricoccus tamworthensis]|uniref:hypothetical protein n=1 Tax=Amaricoccus tamworthensis TaxID=57002 RepID=UPI003C79B8E0